MQLTGHQRDAVEIHDQNLVVVAGAGSGKTRVLVERYVRLLEVNRDWSLTSLVAITFTRKAAGEMRDRVRQRLEEKLHTATDGIGSRWAELLANMDSARITTIHSLCADILRANAAVAALDPGFDVLDETQAIVLLENVLDEALESLAQSKHESVVLFEHYDGYVIRDALRGVISADFRPLPDGLMAIWQEEWQEHSAIQLEAMLSDGAFADALTVAMRLSWPRGDKLSEVWDVCQQPLAVLRGGAGVDGRLNALADLISAINLRGGTAANWGDKAYVEEARDVLRTVREVGKEWLSLIGAPPDEHDALAAQLLPHWEALIHFVREVYSRAKASQNALDFDDLERLTHDLLNTSPHKEQVRARYAGEFRHFLVDEFQDTNHRQWEIIQALASPQHGGRLFVVGDPKQSIYGFRGADVSVFNAVRRQLTDPHMPSPGREIPLAESFRTHRPLVEAFNALFGRILTQDPNSPVKGYEIAYERPMEARRQPPGTDPALRLLLLGAYADKLSAEDARRWEAYELAQYVRQTVEAGTLPVYDREAKIVRPIAYRDFALLFRAMTQVNLYEDAFKAAGVPYITIAGRGYYSRQEVWDLLNLLAALHNPLDNLALASIMRSPLFNLSDDALLALRLLVDGAGERLPLWYAMQQAAGSAGVVPVDEQPLLQFAVTILQDLLGLARRVTISELLREALDMTGYLAVLSGLPDGDRRRGNVEKLVEKAQTSGYVTLSSFTQYLRDMSEREVREGEALLDAGDAVTLMTVHVSKGLEFPHVILVDTSSIASRPDTLPVMVDPQYGLVCRVVDHGEGGLVSTFAYRSAKRLAQLRETAERRRLLYVAATRAQDYLLVSGNISGKNTEKGWLGWLLEALDLELSGLDGENRLEHQYAWGQLLLMLPSQAPPMQFITDAPAIDDTDVDTLEKPIMPPLLGKVRVDRRQFARHLTATQIADLGSPEPYHQRRFQQRVLRDPAGDLTLPPATDQVERPTGKQLGEIVHEALRWWGVAELDPDHPDFLVAVENYAWEQGVSNEDARRNAVRISQTWLRRIQESDVFGWMQHAVKTFRELPFVYRNDQRIIHGVIDTLFQREDGTWVIVDYKTSFVAGYAAGLDDLLARHAERYHLQVGVYAAAVRELLRGTMPETYIHYIRYQRTVQVHPAQWQSALDQLENQIGKLILEEDQQ